MNAFERMSGADKAQEPRQLELSPLVKRLIHAREDAAKSSIHWHLIQHTDERLRESLGFTDDDIRALRAGRFLLPWSHRSMG